MPTPLLKLSDLHTSFFTDAGEVKAVRKKKGDRYIFIFLRPHLHNHKPETPAKDFAEVAGGVV